jgi:outer membrane immunogenic protein
MQRCISAGVGAVAVIFATGAQGADLPRQTIKAPPGAVAIAPSWAGFYLGGSLGGRWADVVGTTISFGGGPPPFPDEATQGYDSSTFRGGIYGGYNWHLWPTVVAGIDLDFAWGSGSASVNALQGLPSNADNFSEFEHGWDAGIRARLGYLFTPTWLIYVTGGIQWQHVEARVICSVGTCGGAAFDESNDTTRSGWTVGGGVETMLTGNWLGRVEYRYADYGTWQTTFDPATVMLVKDFDLTTHTAFAGLAFRF